jgi:hypothetical protein
MLPMIMKLHVKEPGKKGIKLWIPVFLVWILLFALMVILLPLMLLAALLTIRRGPGLALILFYPMVWAILWSLSKLHVDVEHDQQKIIFSFL